MPEDPLEFFRLRALANAHPMRIKAELVNESLSILCASFGTEWLCACVNDVKKASIFPDRKHPLGRFLHVAGEPQIAEVIELGRYLLAFSSSPAFGTIVSTLAAPSQYQSTLLQLATAYRLRRALNVDVHLEPPAQNGRLGDISFEYASNRYNAECYLPRIEGEVTPECELLLKDCLKILKEADVPISAAIQLWSMPNAALRKVMVGLIREQVKEIKECPPHADTFKQVLISGKHAIISLSQSFEIPLGSAPPVVRHPAFPRQGNDYVAACTVGHASEHGLRGIQRANIHGVARGIVALWLPPEEETEASLSKDLTKDIEQLSKKIEKKVAQTRGDEGVRGLVIAETWIATQMSRATEGQLKGLRRRVLDNHARIDALLLMSRHWNHESRRHKYHIFPVTPVDRREATAGMLDEVVRLEATTSIP
ncbi:hypothetical protein [Cystobacter fuscus]|uniref:hypothetical protein n=1 Tax=Cystobacter fuscus TaxID=43 RepID=UPI002B2B28F3|nr:hypothetical protein F0U63_44650 [Cystobacter fuscus]